MNPIDYIRVDIADGVGSIEKARELAAANPGKLELVPFPDETHNFCLFSKLNIIEFNVQSKEFSLPQVKCPVTGIVGVYDQEHYEENQAAPNTIGDLIKNVELFHYLFKHPIGTELRLLTPEEVNKRYNYIREELDEFQQAKTIDQQFDAMLDMLYFIFGNFVIAGYDGKIVEEGFLEVQASNMTKLGEDGKPIYKEGDGKIMKGPNYREPQLQAIIDKFISKKQL
jgi:predicted HAD superfamily Cof-like phosphohydrolase